MLDVKEIQEETKRLIKENERLNCEIERLNKEITKRERIICLVDEYGYRFDEIHLGERYQPIKLTKMSIRSIKNMELAKYVKL